LHLLDVAAISAHAQRAVGFCGLRYVVLLPRQPVLIDGMSVQLLGQPGQLQG
jgi:hypothetical protein